MGGIYLFSFLGRKERKEDGGDGWDKARCSRVERQQNNASR